MIDEDGANVDWSDTIKKSEEVAKEKQELTKEKQHLRDLERLAIMNPTRELEDITIDYKKKFYVNGKLDIYKYYKAVKQAHKAILAPGSHIDRDTYNLIIKWWYLQGIINDIKRYKWEKVKEIIKMLEEIRDKSTPADYKMA